MGIKAEYLDVLGPEVTPPDHVEHPTGSSTDDMLSIVELADILSDAGPTDAGVALNVHVVAESEHDGLDLDG